MVVGAASSNKQSKTHYIYMQPLTTTRRLLILAFTLLSLGANAQEKKMKAYMVSDAHLDTQWNWDVQATIRDHIRNTLTQNLYLLKNYPDYIFNFEGAVKYAWMKEYYPLQYEEMKKYVASGRWHITGSSWDANEAVVGSPEAFLRNIMLGQNFYRKEFNTEGTDIFLPDCFGFSYTLPTLASHCGLIGFSSQKLAWRVKPFYEGNRRYPFTVGLWQGIDGSRIMMTHGFGYGQRYTDDDLSKNNQLQKEVKESPLNIVYRYYGTGDTGGSPTIASVRAIEKGIKGDGPIEIISATSDQLYKDFLPYEDHPELPVFDGELPMDVHGNGCYTSQAAMKLYNRQNEHLGDAAERTAVVADWLGVNKYPAKQLTESWQRFIWHQFHDDMTGTSIPRAYEFSWNDELLSLKSFSDVMTHSLNGIASKLDTKVSGQPVVVYNNETFPVDGIAQIAITDGKNYQAYGPNGKAVASQMIEKNGQRFLLFHASAPSTGYAVYSMKAGSKKATANYQSSIIENVAYRIQVDKYGDITSLFDKRANKELVANGKSLRLVVFDECLSEVWPAWEIQKATIDREPVAVHDGVSISVEKGSMRQTLVIRKKYGESDIVQRIHLYNNGPINRIDFENEVDWRSENALLKAEFPLSVSNKEATYDIGLGSVKRPNNQEHLFEVYAHEWTDLTDRSGDYGISLLTDSRYGWDKPTDNTMRLSLLYSPKVKNNYTYQARQDMGYHVFTYSLIGHQGALDMAAVNQQSKALNSPLKTFRTSAHKGELGRTFSFVSSDNDQVMVRALKRAENSNEYIVRVYELSGKQSQKANITFASDITLAFEADGTERTIGAAEFDGHSLRVDIKPFSVKTYKVTLKRPFQRINVDTRQLTLNYDRYCFSSNAFLGSLNFADGYTYAAELLPDEGLVVNDIPFTFGDKDAKNGLSCQGDTIMLPTDKSYRHLYLLAASDNEDRQACFLAGNSKHMSKQTMPVPYYTGFVGQWGHDGQTEAYLKDAQVAYIGTHRHSSAGDEPYEFTYMFLLKVDIPAGATQVILPNDQHIVIFAATLANDNNDTEAAAPLFHTSMKNTTLNGANGLDTKKENLLKSAKVIAVSGECKKEESATNLIDDNTDTKWCDVTAAPNYVVFDFGQSTTISKWRLLNAGTEDLSYVTRTCLLQGRNSETEEWKTLDMFDGNRNNTIERRFQPVSIRYVRLFVVNSAQTTGDAARIYEFGLYD